MRDQYRERLVVHLINGREVGTTRITGGTPR
jgi:hypothetical protein